MAASDTVFSFTMSGQRFDFDADPMLLTGDQTQIIRERTGQSAMQWVRRLLAGDLDRSDEQDFVVMAYLARYRENELLDWGWFIRTIAPLTLQFAAAEKPAAKKPAGARAARSSAKAPETTTS